VKEILEKNAKRHGKSFNQNYYRARYFLSIALASCIVLPCIDYWPASCYKRIYIYSLKA
jgi:hypothetical protein